MTIHSVTLIKHGDPLAEHVKLQPANRGDIENATAYKVANPLCTSADATKYAKAVEERLRKEASSRAEYEEQCSRIAEELLSSTAAGSSEEQSKEESIPAPADTGLRYGRFVNAQHYRDGLFSEIFKASVPTGSEGEEKGVVVALKVCALSANTPPHDGAREARILEVARGEHIVPLLETFQQPGHQLVMAFPFMPHDLNDLLHRKELTPMSGRTVLRDLFSGLAHLHDLHIIHRDIKPSNILLQSRNGPAYIADFGIAWHADDPACEPANTKILDVGTTCYRPPELLFGKQDYSERLDMWAAGCVAAQVVSLNGTTLFDAGDLGSELALIKSIFETLGTPNTDTWPESSTLPDWGKMNFRQYSGKAWSEILPTRDHSAIDLVKNLVVLESGQRFSAAAALSHSYFDSHEETT